jgi:hypothetical protein
MSKVECSGVAPFQGGLFRERNPGGARKATCLATVCRASGAGLVHALQAASLHETLAAGFRQTIRSLCYTFEHAEKTKIKQRIRWAGPDELRGKAGS